MPTQQLEKQSIETRTAKAWMEGEHLIKIKVHQGAVIMLEDAQEHIQIGKDLAQKTDYMHMLIDVRGVRAISREARAFYSHPIPAGEKSVTTAIAIITGSPLSR